MSFSVQGSAGVASGHPEAASAGVATLAAGGSSVDACLAMAFAQWVVSGPTCGPGGDLFVMHVDGGNVINYGGWSRTPKSFDMSEALVSNGPRAAVVPGALAGAEAAWRAAGKLTWAELFAPAIRLSTGHAVTPWMARSYSEVDRRGKSASLAAFIDQDGVPRPGDRVSCSRLGHSLELIAAEGASAFYGGELAEQIVAAASRDGAWLTQSDLDALTADVSSARSHAFGDMDITYPPPPSQAGITARLLASVRANDSAVSRTFAEMVAPLTKTELIDRCVVGVPGTAASVASDGLTSAVVVHSLAGVQFGTGWMIGDTGIAIGNRVGTSLSTREDLVGANPVPGGTVPHTLSAALFRSEGRSLLIATPGGDRQVQWLAQAGQRFRADQSLDDIVAGPRWFVCPEGDRFGVPAGIDLDWYMFAEEGVEWRDDGEVCGFGVRPVDSVGGGLQGAMAGADGWSFGSDPRGGGCALAAVGGA